MKPFVPSTSWLFVWGNVSDIPPLTLFMYNISYVLAFLKGIFHVLGAGFRFDFLSKLEAFAYK